MEDEQVWLLAFAQVAGIQFHPRNHRMYEEWPALTETAINYSADVADMMLKKHRERFPKEGS